MHVYSIFAYETLESLKADVVIKTVNERFVSILRPLPTLCHKRAMK